MSVGFLIWIKCGCLSRSIDTVEGVADIAYETGCYKVFGITCVLFESKLSICFREYLKSDGIRGEENDSVIDLMVKSG